MRKNKVLVPLDGSAFSRQILVQLPRYLDAATNQLILYQVVEEPHPVHIHEGGVDLDIYLDQIEDGLQAKLADELQADMAQLRAAGFEVQSALDFGKRPAKKIEAVVCDLQIDLIAMTTHGRNALGRVLAGSVAEHLLHHVDVPILLVRPQKEPVRPTREEAYPIQDQRAVMPLV